MIKILTHELNEMGEIKKLLKRSSDIFIAREQ